MEILAKMKALLEDWDGAWVYLYARLCTAFQCMVWLFEVLRV